jgi:hypothetical protein
VVSNILSLPVKTILVLEDESAVMTLMRHMLKAHTLIQPATAEEAIRLFSEHGRQVHLLVADVTLPKSSGIQVALLLPLKDCARKANCLVPPITSPLLAPVVAGFITGALHLTGEQVKPDPTTVHTYE